MKLLHQTKLFLNRNSATMLTCVGGVGVVATTVMAVKATPKALKVLEQAKEEKGEELTVSEMIQVAGPTYIPTAIMGAATLTCIFSANILNKRHQASITSAYALLDSSYKEYRNKVTAIYGDDADENVRDEIAKDKYKESEVNAKTVTELFYDEYSKRFFESTIARVKEAEYRINRDLVMQEYATLNDFYEYVGLDPIPSGDSLGWTPNINLECYWQEWIDFTHSRITMDDGVECHSIVMLMEPVIDFEDYL